MYPSTLRPLLTNPGFAPADINAAAILCQDWFRHSASLEAFVVSSVFHDLIGRGFGDQQGVATAEWNEFLIDVLPRVIAVIDALAADPTQALRDLAISYHSSL